MPRRACNYYDIIIMLIPILNLILALIRILLLLLRLTSSYSSHCKPFGAPADPAMEFLI